MKSDQSKRTLGIIGGMGPHSDIAFLEMLHSRANAESDSDYIPVLYEGNCRRPDRSDFLTKKSKRCPGKSLITSLKNLEKCGASVIVMPCNTAHYWSKLILKNKRRKTVFIDMISAVTEYCRANSFKKVILLATPGTYEKNIYRKSLSASGIECIYPDNGIREKLLSVIRDIKRGKSADLSFLDDFVADSGCDKVILGCTELCLAGKNSGNAVYIDSLSVLTDKIYSVLMRKTNASKQKSKTES